MKRILIMILLMVLIAPAAQAQDEILLGTQYYGHLRDTCKKNNVERVWNRWFGDKQKNLSEDTCCMNSVAEMEKKSAFAAEGGVCPDGERKNKLGCPTSKEWCEKAQ
ncbi:MAG: hypothetical protein DYH13_09910 [Alphaproteobacteria bacterium PRO2]|nr:hypothetical protein [Alphaproteobacteria bacterium PRO2]